MENNNALSKNLPSNLRTTVADLETVTPWLGLWRFISLGIVVLGLATLAWSSHHSILFFGYTALTGIFYTFWLICTHDAVHHTLTGWTWFDELVPRLISYFMMWPHGTYAQLHRLHHAWNGINLDDPERVQWTLSEYQQASPWMQWYIRHQLVIDLFGLAGVGLIAKTSANAFRLRQHKPSLPWMLLLDGIGILAVQSICIVFAIWHHKVLEYLLFWLVLERVVGMISQARDHLEHYAQWGKATGHQLTQLYACRNLQTSPLVAWLMGGLNYHSIHHAFPSIPFNHLREAFYRIQGILEQHKLPSMTVGAGYVQETLRLSNQALLIGEPNPNSLTGRHQMLSQF